MERNYTVQTKIERPVSEVFMAVVESDRLCRYFTSETTGDLKEGQEIHWRWADYEFALPVRVERIVRNERIELTIDSAQWKKTVNEGYPVRIVFDFEKIDEGSTMLAISESGWRTDSDGLKGSHENCSGWTHMTMCLKAWVEHGIDLR